jgi:antitoxin component YwqK of YwqJK toxin-antitoxin module
MRYFLTLLFCLLLSNQALPQQAQLGTSLNKFKFIKGNLVNIENIFSCLDSIHCSMYCQNVYNNAGKVILSKTFSASGAVVDVDSIIYDAEGHVSKEIQDSAGRPNHVVNYFFDKRSNTMLVSKFDTANKLIYSQKRMYDVNDRLVIIYKNKDTAFIPDIEYEYDKNGLITRTVDYENGDTLNDFTNKYRAQHLSHSYAQNAKDTTSIDYTYNKNFQLSEKRTTVKTAQAAPVYNTEKTTYYPGGLVFEKLLYNNNTLTERLRCYYVFYK